MALPFDRLIERFAGNSGNRILTGRINFCQHEAVSALERIEKFVEEIARSCEAVRLKDHRQRTIPTVADGADGGANLRWMMAVIVDDHNSPGLAFELKAAMDAGKGGHGFNHVSERSEEH